MPDRTEAQVRFVNSERILRFGQLNVSLPQLFLVPVANIAAQQITTIA